MVAIAREARGHAVADSSGNWRFGSKGGLCVYANGQYHDFSGGAREHGFNALQLIEHLYPAEDVVAWVRAWLAQHSGNGSFTPGESEPVDDFAEVEAVAFLNSLYNGAAPIDVTPGYIYLTKTHGLPLRREDQAQLRWIANYRGDEGALLAPVTDDEGKLVKLLVIYVTLDGRKSPYGSGRSTIRGAKRRGLYRLGSPGPNVVETEGLEKGLAARAAGAEYVVVTGGASNLGKVPLPPLVRSIVIARDADPAASPSDLALWRAVVHRLGQGLEVAVPGRPNDIAPKDAPSLKDLDDVYRYDPEIASVLLKVANLEHGRLGEAADDAILDLASRLDAVALGRARKGIAQLLGTSLGALDDELALRVRARIEAREAQGARAADGPEPWDDVVTDIGAVLDDAVRIMKKYVAATNTHFDTTALWCLHTHLIHREELGIDITPRQAFQSPEEDSGKTTFMKLVRAIVPRPKGVGSLTGSSLFRAVDARKCTLLVDEGDFAFRADANPDLLAIFNSGNERTFAFVSRSVPQGDGQFKDHDFSTFAAMCFTSINKLATKSMQSRCISLPMKPATKEEAAKLIRFRSNRAQDLEDCGRKFARWAADLSELPEVEVPADFVNRIADNWRSLFQIAHLTGGDWPARVLAAAQADAAGDGEEPRERGTNGLLDAIWRVFAGETTDPRRMHTSELVQKLMGLDDGRWRVANQGKLIDEYYLRAKLKGYVTPPSKKGEEPKIPPRQWRPAGSPTMKWGYHELHFRDAFLRYLGKGLPSEAPSEPADDEKDESLGHPFPPKHPPSSASSTAERVSPDISTTYTAADDDADADQPSASNPAQSSVRMSHPHPQQASAAGQDTELSHETTHVRMMRITGGQRGKKIRRKRATSRDFHAVRLAERPGRSELQPLPQIQPTRSPARGSFIAPRSPRRAERAPKAQSPCRRARGARRHGEAARR
jgi:Protein of unknown function (DUF3631)